jgi:hypothetical protein
LSLSLRRISSIRFSKRVKVMVTRQRVKWTLVLKITTTLTLPSKITRWRRIFHRPVTVWWSRLAPIINSSKTLL